MCGIAGKISTNAAGIRLFAGAWDGFSAIKRRGPDSQGQKAFDCRGHRVSLMHARLSIIDLSDFSHQPMQDAVSGWWITYNGEIYNYLEVRKELQSMGWSFSSNGDSEVLLKAWAQWGLDGLQRLNGMFAFAAFHPGSGELWLVRDRFGVKPLAWGRLPDGGFAFSSSIAGLASQAGSEIDVSYCARGVRYNTFETATSGSPFKNVYTVPAGSWLKVNVSESGMDFSEGRWYDLSNAVSARAETVVRSSDDDLIERCRSLLEDAVRLRLRSDVPVAVSLSGGLDSSAIASLAARGVTGLRGFTYGSPVAPSSEGPEVFCFSKSLGIDVTYIWPRFNPIELSGALERAMAFQEAPFSGLSVIAQNEIYRSARRAGFKVLLGGQGGDEIFAGYRKFFLVALREALNRREAKNALGLMTSFGIMMMHEASQARMYWENLNRYRPTGAAAFRLLAWEAAPENLWGSRHSTLSERQMEDVQQWSLPTLLRYEDRNSMGYGIESRLPFMDYRLLELALALPVRMKIRNGYGKWALRQMTAGSVPDSIRLARKKRGFDVTQAWVSEGVGASLRRMVFDARSRLSEHLRPEADLDRMLSDTALSGDGNLLDEALMLAWLSNPMRSPAVADVTAVAPAGVAPNLPENAAAEPAPKVGGRQ